MLRMAWIDSRSSSIRSAAKKGSELSLDLLPEVGWEIVRICLAIEPLAAAWAEHFVLAPVVDEDHC